MRRPREEMTEEVYRRMRWLEDELARAAEERRAPDPALEQEMEALLEEWGAEECGLDPADLPESVRDCGEGT